MNKPELLSDLDKYRLDPSDFSRALDRFIFAAIYNLYLGGAEHIHTADIDNYLKTNAVASELLENENGLQFIQDCEAQSDYSNFSFYYGKLKKINLLRDLSRNGYDISGFYCEDPLDDNYYTVNDNFEKLSVCDILNKIKGTYAALEGKYAFNTVVEESSPLDGLREYLEELKIKPEVGVNLQGDIYNTVVRGGRKGALYLRSAESGLGKALPNYTKIPTPNGWTTVGEVKVGDYLFDRMGKPTKVLEIFPQGQKEIYKVYFKSGRVAECCKDHLWSYYNSNAKDPYKLHTSTTEEILNNPIGLQGYRGQYRWLIPICKPVEFSEKKYSIDPYVMGLILGDGSFRYRLDQKAFYFSSGDEELVKEIQIRMGYALYKKNSGKNYSWIFELPSNNSHKNVWVEDILKDYPELWQAKSEDKFIPKEYLNGSIEQRFDLLAGLLDTDGSIDKKCGRISFTTISEFLKNDFIELCESLGLTCHITIDKREWKYTTGICYNISVLAPKELKPKLFKLKRKVEIAQNYANNNKRTECRDRDAIVKIEATGTFTEMTCFIVDNEEHLFLMNNYICTHNSRRSVGDACYIAYPIRYEPQYGKWISTGQCEKVLYVMTEQDPREIQTMVLSYLTGINEEYFKLGTYTEEHMDRINKALAIMEKYKDNLLFARIPEPTPSIVKNLFRRYNLQNGVDNFFFDYIFSNEAMLAEYRDLKLPEHVCLRLFTTALKNLAIELNSFILTSTQISEQELNQKSSWKDYHNIAGAKSVAHLVDIGGIMSRPTPEEQKLIEGFQKLYNLKPNLVMDMFKNRGGRWTMLRIWSYFDAGTCRTYDLFATTPDLKPLEDFQIIDFVKEINPELKAFEESLNENLTEIPEDLSPLEEIEIGELDLKASIEKAFGSSEEQRKRVQSKNWEDFDL